MKSTAFALTLLSLSLSAAPMAAAPQKEKATFATLAKPKADPSLEIPTQAMVYVPVVVKLKDAFPTTKVEWDIVPEPAWSEKLAEAEGVGFRFTGPPARYAVRVDFVDFKKELWGKASGSVTITGLGPSPVDPIDPPPVDPVDPELVKVRAAYEKDSPLDPYQRKVAANKLIAFYRAAAIASKTSRATIANDLFKDIAAVDSTSGVEDGWLKNARAIVAVQLRAVWGTDQVPSGSPVTEVYKTGLANVYTRYADLLETVVK